MITQKDIDERNSIILSLCGVLSESVEKIKSQIQEIENLKGQIKARDYWLEQAKLRNNLKGKP